MPTGENSPLSGDGGLISTTGAATGLPADLSGAGREALVAVARTELAELQRQSIDEFVLWWERHVGRRADVRLRRDRRTVQIHSSASPGGGVAGEPEDLPSYDLARATSYWRDRFAGLTGRLTDVLPASLVVECGAIFDLEANAFPHRIADDVYLILVRQGWISLGAWVAQTFAIMAAEPQARAQQAAARRFAALPRLACSVIGDESLDLDDALPAPDDLDALPLEHPGVISYAVQGEAFILLHELAHILLGHVESLEEALDRGLTPEAETTLRQQYEFEADARATELLLAACPPGGRVNEWALCALFWLMHTAEAYSSLTLFPLPGPHSHPEPADRLASIIDILAQRQPLTLDRETLLAVCRSLEPARLAVADKAEDDLGPWRVLEVQTSMSYRQFSGLIDSMPSHPSQPRRV